MKKQLSSSTQLTPSSPFTLILRKDHTHYLLESVGGKPVYPGAMSPIKVVKSTLGKRTHMEGSVVSSDNKREIIAPSNG